MHNLHTRIIHVQHRNINQKNVSRNNPSETRFFSGATQVKPCRAGLGTGWVTHREYRREGPYFALSFLLLLFSILCGVIFKSVLKSILLVLVEYQNFPGLRRPPRLSSLSKRLTFCREKRVLIAGARQKSPFKKMLPTGIINQFCKHVVFDRNSILLQTFLGIRLICLHTVITKGKGVPIAFYAFHSFLVFLVVDVPRICNSNLEISGLVPFSTNKIASAQQT